MSWPKLTVACHTGSRLLVAAVVSCGPTQDSPQFPAVARQARRRASLGRVSGDAAYDGEHNHALCRERLGVPETLFRLNPRNAGRKWPKTPYRRSMKRGFPKGVYHQRWPVETTFQECRSGTGFESTRGRGRNTVTRAAPCLLGAYSVVALRYHDLPAAKRTVGVRWDGKDTVAFSDALTAVRRWLWTEAVFPQAKADVAVAELPDSIRELLLAGLAPAP